LGLPRLWGYPDDALILPLGILAVVRLIPPEEMAELRATAAAPLDASSPVSRIAAAIIVQIWLAGPALAYAAFTAGSS